MDIHRIVKRLIKRYETRNPLTIAKELGIYIEYKNYTDDTKGYFINLLRNKFIVVNSNLNEHDQQIVLAHELGHAILHSSRGTCMIREYTLFPRGIHENEANKFAAELLIDETTISKEQLAEMSIDQLSCFFCTPQELISYKFDNYNDNIIKHYNYKN
ncbi:ImmA/IrrE family metallo-endopeptidase [Clostridium cylindrosporum]|uniref:IrrE N-terminal-like domain-containing protein n=1 Tax=Clostridium cylindrosporum DSM 605 TaxID=1121307 RepID=A0A0J8DFL9_CLOCY|nr:ImmA/IrrE family metallo-endopeptidase [Clostridium cylindrosporum]KMT22973.1 hypothetical protein CLCY_7c00200 [Clostridium cylindrosporum DSM 605]